MDAARAVSVARGRPRRIRRANRQFIPLETGCGHSYETTGAAVRCARWCSREGRLRDRSGQNVHRLRANERLYQPRYPLDRRRLGQVVAYLRIPSKPSPCGVLQTRTANKPYHVDNRVALFKPRRGLSVGSHGQTPFPAHESHTTLNR